MRDEATRNDQAKAAGYGVIGSFRLPPSDWHAYYAGVEGALREAIAKHGELDLYRAARTEQELYEACGDDYGYVCLGLQASVEST